MPKTILALVVLAVLVPGTVPVAAQSAAELLEKAVYLEETAGRLEQAIEVYRRIVNDAAAGRVHVAEALLRLGLCQLKNGDSAAASEALERVLAEYPEQEALVARAREHLPGEPELELLPAPWQDGEVLRLGVKLASGTPVGVIFYTADAAERDGEELWRLRTRRTFYPDTAQQRLSQVLARRDDMTPVASVYRQAGLGHFEAVYGDGAVMIETRGAAAPREEKLDGPVFDNEEVLHLLRRLPLEPGFKETIQIITTVLGGAGGLVVGVKETEAVTVPAGEFECYRVELNIPQVFWYSTDPSRVLVKFEAAGFVVELEEVYVQEPGRGSVYSEEVLGYSVSLPPDWLFYSSGDYFHKVILLLDPNAEAQARMEVRSAEIEPGDCFDQASADHKLQQAKSALRDYRLREGTWREWRLGGWPAVSFVGDYREMDAEKVHYWTLIQNGEFCVEFQLKVAADRFEALREVFDRIIGSYEGPPPPKAPDSPAASASANSSSRRP